MGFGRGRFSLNRMLMKLDLGPLAGGTFPKFCPQSCVCKFVLIFLKRAPQVVQAPGPTQAEELPLAAPPLPGPAPLWLPQPHLHPPPAGSQPFRCLYCAATFRFPGALQHHVTTEHFKQSESTFPCELCGELFTSQAQLDCHLESEHPKVLGAETQSQMVQVIVGPWIRGCGPRGLEASPEAAPSDN